MLLITSTLNYGTSAVYEATNVYDRLEGEFDNLRKLKQDTEIAYLGRAR